MSEDPEARRLARQVAEDLWAAHRCWVRHPRYYDEVREWMACGWPGFRRAGKRDEERR